MNFRVNFATFITYGVFIFLEAEREHNSVPFKLLWRNIINPQYMEKFIGLRFLFLDISISMYLYRYVDMYIYDLSLILRLFLKIFFKNFNMYLLDFLDI